MEAQLSTSWGAWGAAKLSSQHFPRSHCGCWGLSQPPASWGQRGDPAGVTSKKKTKTKHYRGFPKLRDSEEPHLAQACSGPAELLLLSLNKNPFVSDFWGEGQSQVWDTLQGMAWGQPSPTTVPLGRQMIISTGKLYFSRCSLASLL